MPAEVGLAAFRAVRDEGLIRVAPPPSADQLGRCLSSQLRVGHRLVFYRFANQRSQRLARALAGLAQLDVPADPLTLRENLLELSGIGLKTASWIVRNQTETDAVAIVDIHIYRACVAAGIFDASWRLPRDYRKCEAAFLAFAAEAKVRASQLDACMWEQIRELGPHVNSVLTAVTESRLKGISDRTSVRSGADGDRNDVLPVAI
jgi:hypothetical protein